MSLTSSNTSRNSTKLRIVFLGDQGVGKSSIIDRYTTNRFDQGHNNTVGIDFNVKDMVKQGQHFRLQMWDTAGQQRYRSLIPTYLKNAHCVVFVYDVTKPSTLHGVRNWQKMFVEHQNAPGILVGNKTDMTNARKVSREDGEELAKELRLSYGQVSAKTGKRVNEMFDDVVDLLVAQQKKEQNLGAEFSNNKALRGSSTMTVGQTEDGLVGQTKPSKPISLKTKGIQWARNLKCCSQ